MTFSNQARNDEWIIKSDCGNNACEQMHECIQTVSGHETKMRDREKECNIKNRNEIGMSMIL